jgi:hypothetical protein
VSEAFIVNCWQVIVMLSKYLHCHFGLWMKVEEEERICVQATIECHFRLTTVEVLCSSGVRLFRVCLLEFLLIRFMLLI